MAITTAFPTTAKKELLQGTHNFGDAAASPIGGNVFKLALIAAGAAGTYGAASTNYSELNDSSPIEEATDTSSPLGYSPGGGTLTNIGASNNSTSGITDFADITFTAVTISADGCMIYNSSQSNKAVGIYSFGTTKTASGGDFTIQFPAAAAGTAVLELA